MIPLPPKKARLSTYSLLLGVYTLVAFHIPFARHAAAHMEGGANSVLLALLGLVLLLGLNYLLYYLLVYCFRKLGRFLVSFTLVGDAIMLYFVNNYEVLVTDEMMGNVFCTQYSEASGFFSFAFVLYVLLLGVLPSVYVCLRALDYGSWKRCLGQTGITVAAIAAVVFGNMKNWPWVDRHSTELGALLMPWSYIVNSIRYFDAERKKNVKNS